ncbi:hypothetical protein [Cupriavidus gilardii]|uniref:terminase small subunit-like protein n=1 Tax=Cupriavidus gilardii TaxID=82541 RepID=UPI001580B5CC|nr:hypothetical protein [Cupriavidus gilardii]QKS60883.1 hypothetical protein FOB47_02645 [Cupriavidus gilardii]
MAVVCERIAGGDSVRKICSDPDMPDRRLINRWIGTDPDLQSQYRAACVARTFHHLEEIIEIADDGLNDTYIDPETGEKKTDHDVIARSRLRIDARKWVMARMNRVDFGDRVTQEHVGKDGGPIEQKTTVVDEREVRDIVDRIEGEY